jgi:hypothetical protein
MNQAEMIAKWDEHISTEALKQIALGWCEENQIACE